MDGLLTDGVLTNGLLTDGVLTNGLLTDGVPTNGLLTDEVPTNGLLTDEVLTGRFHMDRFLTEAEVIRIMKGGKQLERELEEKEEFLAEERARQVRDRKKWNKLGFDNLLVMEEPAGEDWELESLLRDMLACRIVRRGLWSIDPMYRRLLCAYYSDRVDAGSIAKEEGISVSTFWRRRQRAVADLVSACQKVPNEIQ